MPHVLLTRPAEEAVESRRRLEAMGYQVTVSPMIETAAVTFEMPEQGRSLVVTSKNGVRHGLRQLPHREWEVFCVGEATAEAARDEGFERVIVGSGTARGLMQELMKNSDSKVPRRFSYICGTEISYNIGDALQQRGMDAENITVYATRPAVNFSPEATEALAAGSISHVLFYSPRAASVFEELIAESAGSDVLRQLQAIALSTRIVSNLLGPWQEIHHAIVPTEDALFTLLPAADTG